jgi:DNA-binding NtrC family response regulator
MMTAYTSTKSAIEAMKLGAYDYISKPFDVEELKIVAQKALERAELVDENVYLRRELEQKYTFNNIIGKSPRMQAIFSLVERVARTGSTVLIHGESGTGKELIAKLLHLLSGREGSLIALNCAALPESLLESELFGIEGGVATGVQARPGKFELADSGTLLLDEIGDMQMPLQVRLLRALQEREVVRVGGRQSIPVDVRLVAATHQDLEALVAAGRFREDLYYRLKGVEVVLPPLRERRGDIPHLVRTFLEEFCRREGIPTPVFRPEALAVLMAHDFPGNVRELQNLVEGSVSLADAEVDAGLVRSLIGAAAQTSPEPLDLGAMERRHIARVLKLTGGNKSEAAKILGLNRKTLQRKGF